jgi:sterol desaturase/sphingolipid hydroxylase (fatty acid hydroxylase superfamily)
MTPDALRFAIFLAGLVTFLSWELAAPDHAPTVPRGQRWLINLVLALINGVVVSAMCTACYALAASNALPWRQGLFESLALPRAGRLVLEVLILDLLVYFLHRLYHRLPFFWRFHKVHHTDLDLDVTSASRFHLGEVLASAIPKFAAVQLLGISPTGLVAFEVALLLAAQFQHANIQLPLFWERFLWWTFVPPAMHRVHHRPARVDSDSNFGTLITVWDRWFGTLRPVATEAERFGLPEFREPAALRMLTVLALPFRSTDWLRANANASANATPTVARSTEDRSQRRPAAAGQPEAPS